MLTTQTIMLDPALCDFVGGVSVVGYDLFLESPVLDIGSDYTTLDRAQRASMDETGEPRFSDQQIAAMEKILEPILIDVRRMNKSSPV